ncbi:hypothetical protein JCM10212_006768 [Sporobolomyces blumeae]
MFRSAVPTLRTASRRTFVSTRQVRESGSVIDQVKQAAATVNRKVSDAALKGIETGESATEKVADAAKEVTGDATAEAKKMGADAKNAAQKTASDAQATANKAKVDIETEVNKRTN